MWSETLKTSTLVVSHRILWLACLCFMVLQIPPTAKLSSEALSNDKLSGSTWSVLAVKRRHLQKLEISKRLRQRNKQSVLTSQSADTNVSVPVSTVKPGRLEKIGIQRDKPAICCCSVKPLLSFEITPFEKTASYWSALTSSSSAFISLTTMPILW